jgi:hypothetical protein
MHASTDARSLIFHHFPITDRFDSSKCRQFSVLGLTRGSLGNSYSAIELRPLALNLVDCTSLSKSRAQRVFFLIFQNWQKPFFLGDLQYVRVEANFVSLFHPAN